ncbi:MAG: creatininase family protein [Micromonosporaceae bacterium]
MTPGGAPDRHAGFDLGDLTAPEIARLAPDAVLLIPIGATEQHGPCLPLRTDTTLISAVVDIARAQLDPSCRIVTAPVMPYGQSQHHLFASAASLRPATLLAVLDDLIESAYASGFRRVFFANGHGGNDECLRIAVKDAATRRPMLLGACNYWDLADPSWRSRHPHIPGHAGAFETSLLLASAPELVRQEDLDSAVPGPPGVHAQPIAAGVTLARSGDWASSGGYTDPPRDADAEAGKSYLDALGSGLADVLKRFAALPLNHHEGRP